MRNIRLGIFNWITLILVALKLLNVIGISWWLVVLPSLVWVGIVALVVVLVIVMLIAGAAKGENIIQKMDEFNKRQMERKRK